MQSSDAVFWQDLITDVCCCSSEPAVCSMDMKSPAAAGLGVFVPYFGSYLLAPGTRDNAHNKSWCKTVFLMNSIDPIMHVIANHILLVLDHPAVLHCRKPYLVLSQSYDLTTLKCSTWFALSPLLCSWPMTSCGFRSPHEGSFQEALIWYRSGWAMISLFRNA